MVLLKRRNISELCAMKQWKHWQAIVAERRLIIIPFNKTVINDNFIKCKYIFRYRFQYFNRVLPPSVPKRGTAVAGSATIQSLCLTVNTMVGLNPTKH